MTKNELMTTSENHLDSRSVSHQKILDEIGYYKAQAITELLYSAGLITFDEYDKLTEINRRTFSPLYADLLPKALEKAPKQS